ncbi:MAG TPA: hypothetical protein VFB60_22810, partial [Ktedonobacteraceae bacterium]|nr:hypothetical protein [Ktedonobacteraceae bacterium]
TMLISSPASICSVYWPIVPLQVFAVKSYTIEDQGFAKVAARADCSRHRRSQGEEGAGGGCAHRQHLPLPNGSQASRSG